MNTNVDANRQRYLSYLDPQVSNAEYRRLRTEDAPLITLASGCLLEEEHASTANHEGLLFPQYGLLGFNVSESDGIAHHEPIMQNINAPSSMFICGSQGSGKSYTLGCILENCLLVDHEWGRLPMPVAGVSFHYDADAFGSVAESAALCSRGVKVRVLCSNSNFYQMKAAYEGLPGAIENLVVEPLLLPPSDLSIERMHRLMAFSEKAGAVPLYMEVIQRILREMAVNGRGRAFNYGDFLRLLQDEGLSREQQSPMNLRLNLLQSFMQWPISKKALKKTQPDRLFRLEPGTLTVVDLSDPFVDKATSCTLFDICLSMIKENRPTCGVVLALDEAHKYLDNSLAANTLTERMIATIREQRHNGIRVVLATQEPTLSEMLLDLCSVSIIHHFKSPAWLASIKRHLAGASMGDGMDGPGSLMERILGLGVGESLVFAPTSILHPSKMSVAGSAGSRILQMRTRMRLGYDAGASVLTVAVR